VIVGIDPDIDKSGVAVISPSIDLLLMNLNFVGLLHLIRNHKHELKRVYLEAGWLNVKSSWHKAQTKNMATKIAKNVGENHAAGKLLAQCIAAEGVEVVLIKPTTSKVDAEQFKKLTKYQGRTNQETRDAAMLIWGR